MSLSVTLNSTEEFSEIAFAAGTIFSILPLLLYQFSYEDLTQGISLSANFDIGDDITYINELNGRTTQKQRTKSKIIIFMVMMLSFTLITQKISYIMTPEVEVTKIRKGEIIQDPSDEKSESLGIHTMIIPNSAIYEGKETIIYVISEEKSIRGRDQVAKINIQINTTNGYEAAVMGVLPYNSEIVKWTSKPLEEGMNVRVVEGRSRGNDK